jgi:hypothetical protein
MRWLVQVALRQNLGMKARLLAIMIIPSMRSGKECTLRLGLDLRSIRRSLLRIVKE